MIAPSPGRRTGPAPARLLALVALALSLLLAGAVVASPADAARARESILDGSTVKSKRHWVAGILRAGEGTRSERHFCGGSLVAREWVLTAAHCVVDEDGAQDPGSLAVVLGDRNLGDDADGREFAVTENLIFPEYNAASSYGDMALLRLAEPAPRWWRPVMLARVGEARIGSLAYIFGWGGIDPFDTEQPRFPERLQGARIPIRPDDDCAEANGGDEDYDGSVMLCAGFFRGRPDTCGGDSGGPLAIRGRTRFRLIGVTSYGKPGCGSRGTYGVYAWVGSPILREWIRETAGA